MIKVEEKKYNSSNGKNKIHTVIWYPDKEKYPEPKGVVQICHGMIDHIWRFKEMAEYIAGKGFVVAGNDHLGHGTSVNNENEYGYFVKGKDPGSYVVEDMHKLTVIMKKHYPDKPYFLIGHSMGSFMVRRYISLYGNELTGTVIMGTGNQPKPLLYSGLLLTKIVDILKGDEYRSRLMNDIMFGAYNRRIPESKKLHDWLTCDEKIVDEYENDPMCSYLFTINGYYGLLNTIAYVSSKKNISKVPSELPVLMVSGEEDPVGGYGRDIKRLFETYCHHFSDVELRLYEDCRHELHSELNREDVFKDIYRWLKKHLK